MDAISKSRWFRLTPDRVLLALPPIWGGLFLCEHFHCLPKGYSVLLAAATLAVILALLLLWFAVALLFRWRFQYSLRSLLLVMLLASIGMSWFAVKMQRASRQREAVEAIKELGGSVNYDWDYSDPPVPACVRNVFGEDFLATAVDVFFPYDGSLTDADLGHLEVLTKLRALSLGGTLPILGGIPLPAHRYQYHRKQVTNAGMKHLRRLMKLEVLDLAKIEITDTALEHLKELKNLQYVDLSGTKVTEDGVKGLLRALPNCHIYWNGIRMRENEASSYP